jgi:hypothetical protein
MARTYLRRAFFGLEHGGFVFGREGTEFEGLVLGEGDLLAVLGQTEGGDGDYENQFIEYLKKHGLYNTMYIQQLVNEFYKGKQEHANKILSLIAFQVWYELYMKS